MVPVTLLTPTGDRPEAFRLLRRWVRDQDYEGDMQWLIVDDGEHPTAAPPGADYVRRTRSPDDPAHTLPAQLLRVLPMVRGDFVLFMEDDDYYSPRYVSHMASLLERHSLVGEGFARYYSVANSRYWRCRNSRHASLGQTAIRREVMPHLYDALRARRDDPVVDVRLWRNPSKGLVFDDRSDRLCLHCAMKNMPGRRSTMKAHTRLQLHGHRDPEGRMLKRWVGEAAYAIYREFQGSASY